MTDDIAEIEAARENAYRSGVRDGRKLERERIAAAIEAHLISIESDWQDGMRYSAAIARTEPS